LYRLPGDFKLPGKYYVYLSKAKSGMLNKLHASFTPLLREFRRIHLQLEDQKIFGTKKELKRIVVVIATNNGALL